MLELLRKKEKFADLDRSRSRYSGAGGSGLLVFS